MTMATEAMTPTTAETPVRSLDLKLLAVGENAGVLRNLTRMAESHGALLQPLPDASSALRSLAQAKWDLLIVVLDEDEEQQLTWWVDVLRPAPRRPRLVALVPSPSIGFAMRAAHLGVFEVLPLDPSREQFRELLDRIRSSGDEEPIELPTVRPVKFGTHAMVSESPAMLPVIRAIAQVAPSSASVLIIGESGTGKELVARAVHLHGPRASGPFIAVNCAAIPENLLESELFGHDKGAFTGAVARKIGRFERAHGGTLFLDEIGDMSLALQSKILRAIQEREIERVGGTESISVDVRLIAATNRDLRVMMTENRFREDLYYRLAVVTIKLPRLLDRGDDLMLLTSAFLKEFGCKAGKNFTHVSDRALELLRRHEWVGNVRELRNVIERAVLVADGGTLRSEHLPEEWRTTSAPDPAVDDSRPLVTLSEMEAGTDR
jgi:two-component system nitrogen regulation response regulator GlnG